jgi:hypothetical protein
MVTRSGDTALHLLLRYHADNSARNNRHLNKLKALLAAGASVNEVDSTGQVCCSSPLALSCLQSIHTHSSHARRSDGAPHSRTRRPMRRS